MQLYQYAHVICYSIYTERRLNLCRRPALLRIHRLFTFFPSFSCNFDDISRASNTFLFQNHIYNLWILNESDIRICQNDLNNFYVKENGQLICPVDLTHRVCMFVICCAKSFLHYIVLLFSVSI